MPRHYTPRVVITCRTCGKDRSVKGYLRDRAQYCSPACHWADPTRPPARRVYERRPLAERFWAKVEQTEGCWLWRGVRGKAGYGQLWANGKKPPYWLHAHRVSYELTYGPIPDGLCVCHRCDNPPCCRPDHLFLGTYRENFLDMYAKGRAHCRNPSPGMRNAAAKLTDEAVLAIRQAHAAGVPRKDLAVEFGVHRDTVSLIVTDKTWRHLL